MQITPSNKKYEWDRLNPMQIGRYAEYYAKMEFTLFGFDVYTTEVDDQGIDFVIRKSEDRYYDVQVKSVRGFNYIYFLKDRFILRENLIAVIILFLNGKEPQLFLVPSIVWKKPNRLFVNRDYPGKKSRPEYGINISRQNFPNLEEYRFDKMVQNLS